MTQPPWTVFDVGAQLERTTLAWVRTALALTAVGALLARFAIITGLPLLGYVVGAALVATGVMAGCRRRAPTVVAMPSSALERARRRRCRCSASRRRSPWRRCRRWPSL